MHPFKICSNPNNLRRRINNKFHKIGVLFCCILHHKGIFCCILHHKGTFCLSYTIKEHFAVSYTIKEHFAVSYTIKEHFAVSYTIKEHFAVSYTIKEHFKMTLYFAWGRLESTMYRGLLLKCLLTRLPTVH